MRWRKGSQQRDWKRKSQRGWRDSRVQEAACAASSEHGTAEIHGSSETQAASPTPLWFLPSPTQIPSSCPLEFENCSAFYIKTLNTSYKVKWRNNPLCPKTHKYKKMKFPYTTWRVTGNGAQSSSGLSPNTQQPKPFKQKNKSNKINESWQKVMQIKLHFFSLLMRRLASDKNIEFLFKSRKNFPTVFMFLKSWQAKDIFQGWL